MYPKNMNNSYQNTPNDNDLPVLNIQIPNESIKMIPKPILKRSNAVSISPLYNDNQKKSMVPELVEPDMNFGLESISCELAYYVYNAYRNKLIHITSKNEVVKFIIKNYKDIRPVHLCTCERHVSQIMYALCNYYRVCRIRKNEVTWYFVLETPAPPEGYLHQLGLIANVTFRNKKKLI